MSRLMELELELETSIETWLELRLGFKKKIFWKKKILIVGLHME